MPRRRGEDVDWYVEMSEWLERRERRRKWVILGVCVAVPLLTMAVVVGMILFKDRLPRSWRDVFPKHEPPAARPTYEGPREVQVENFHPGIDIRFAQLDPNGMVTTSTHVFRELLPENSKAFTVAVEDETHGKIHLYRLRNLGTGETSDFTAVTVKKILTAGWVIEMEKGWTEVRNALQAKMKTQLAMPIIGR